MSTEIPVTWEWVEVSQLVRNISLTNKKLKSGSYQEKGRYPVIDQSQQFISGYSNDEMLLLEVSTPSIVFGDHTRAVKYVNFSFVPGADGIKVLQPLGLFPKYLYYAIAAVPLPDRGYARHFQFLNSALIPVPPLLEQQRIVAKIEELFTKLEAGVAALKKTQVLLKRYRQAVLKAAVEGELSRAWREANPDVEPAEKLLLRNLSARRAHWERSQLAKVSSGSNPKLPERWRARYKEPEPPSVGGLRELPGTWIWVSAQQIAGHIVDGTHHTPTYIASGIPFVSAKDISGFTISLLNTRFIPTEEHNQLIRRCHPKFGDVLVTKSGTIGRTAVVTTHSPFSLFESVALLPMLGDVIPQFISYCVFTSSTGRFGAQNQKGVAVRHLHLEDLRRLPISLPPREEQLFIVEEVERQFSVIDSLEASVIAELKRSEQLRQAIFKKAFSGQLAPQNPDDEPASVLLERIKGEKEVSTARGSRGGKRAKQGKLFS